MIVNDITELDIVNVYYRGVANEECIAIVATSEVNLGQYGIMLGHLLPTNRAVPFIDHLFWFGDGIVQANDWLFVYTGSGNARTTRTVNNSNNVFSLYWGKAKTVFASTSIVPILFRLDAVDIALTPDVNQLQLPGTLPSPS